MGLTAEYDEVFERLWNLYPKWPTGRSKKKPSYDAFNRARKLLKFTPKDVDAIAADIEARIVSCETWQHGNKYGPPMFATYCNQHLWNEPFERKGRPKPVAPSHIDFAPTPAPTPVTEASRARAAEALAQTMADLKRTGQVH